MAISAQEMADVRQLTGEHYPLESTTGLGIAVLKEIKGYGLWNKFMQEGRHDASGGKYIEIDLMSGQSQAAKMSHPYESTTIRREDVMDTARAEWKMAQVYWTISEMELRQNRGSARRIELVRVKRLAARLAILKLMLQQILLPPATTAASDKNASGILYHLSEITGAQVTAKGGNSAVCGDFQGGNPYARDGQQFTSWQNVSRAETPLLRNWCDTWSSPSGFGDPLDVQRLDLAKLMTAVEAPMGIDEALSVDWKWWFMTDTSNYTAMLQAARSQDMKLGPDLGQHLGNLLYNNNMVKHERLLDTVTNTDGALSHPFIGINLEQFKLHVLTDERGMALSESDAYNEQEFHDVLSYFLDIYFNVVGYNPQEMGLYIGYKAAA